MLSAMSADETATERVRQRIAEWVKQRGHGAQRELLKNIKAWCRDTRSDQWLSDILNRRAKIMLDDVDLVACAMEVPPGDLIRQRDRNYLELTMQESAVVLWFRSMTTDARRYFLGWLGILAGNTKIDTQSVARRHDDAVKLSRPAEPGGTLTHALRDQGSASLDLSSPELIAIDVDIAAHIAELGRLHNLRKSTLASIAARRADHAAKRGPHDRTAPHDVARHSGKKHW